MDHFMTPEEATEMELSLNPFKRSRQVREALASFGLHAVGLSADFAFLGRGTLVRFAESHQSSVATVEALRRSQEISE